jgi:hypothetical protein
VHVDDHITFQSTEIGYHEEYGGDFEQLRLGGTGWHPRSSDSHHPHLYRREE